MYRICDRLIIKSWKKKNVFRATDWEYVNIEKFKMAVILVQIRNFLQLLWN